ncbi:MAG: hypoxanthine phosphoribosyltransferase [Anaerolineaceae bacterium]|nr:hypoxanthine phosphoribosyltransferase [Anaerolineaceae bacterium]
MFDDFVDKVLITEKEIIDRIDEIGKDIAFQYKDSKEILLMGLLKGSVPFIVDLMRAIENYNTVSIIIDFMLVSSYSGDKSRGDAQIELDHRIDIAGCDVILVDDIIDTGITIHTVKKLLLGRNPRSLRTCVLLDKPERREVDVEIDYLGFTIPNYFVIGYGLDIDENGRYLPYVASVDVEKYARDK